MVNIALDEERDKVFAEVLSQPENKVCFDCGASNPKWASANNAVLICFQCAGKHRAFGVHISFVRSCGLDKWKPKELEQMRLGGNKAAKAYFEKNDLIQAGQHNYNCPLAAKYRSTLAKKAEEAITKKGAKEEAEPSKNESEEEEIMKVEVPKENPKPIEKKVVPIERPAQPTTSTLVKKDQLKQPKLNAKKLDIDFESLGSEDTVEELEVKPVPKPKPKVISTAEDTDKSKFKKMKAISSTDYMKDSGDSAGTKERLAKFSNAKGISSDDYYGVPKKNGHSEDGNGFMEKAKDIGFTVFESAKEKVTNLKTYATDLMDRFKNNDNY